MVKSPPADTRHAGVSDLIPGSGRSLEKEIATYSSILARKILWIEEAGRLQSMGYQTVGHDNDEIATNTTTCHLLTINF